MPNHIHLAAASEYLTRALALYQGMTSVVPIKRGKQTALATVHGDEMTVLAPAPWDWPWSSARAHIDDAV